jgi:hypothetical protein
MRRSRATLTRIPFRIGRQPITRTLFPVVATTAITGTVVGIPGGDITFTRTTGDGEDVTTTITGTAAMVGTTATAVGTTPRMSITHTMQATIAML